VHTPGDAIEILVTEFENGLLDFLDSAHNPIVDVRRMAKMGAAGMLTRLIPYPPGTPPAATQSLAASRKEFHARRAV
jgi:hypothetical protein